MKQIDLATIVIMIIYRLNESFKQESLLLTEKVLLFY